MTDADTLDEAAQILRDNDWPETDARRLEVLAERLRNDRPGERLLSVPAPEVVTGDLVLGQEGRPMRPAAMRLRRVAPSMHDGMQVNWRLYLINGAGKTVPWNVPLGAYIVVARP